jgi:hypothetical protein
LKYENVKLTLNSCYLCTWFWESAKMREFLIFFFKFDDFLLTFLTNCFYRTVENSLDNIIIIEKIYVDNECSVIMLNLSAAPLMVQRHYGSRDCRPLRELTTIFQFILIRRIEDSAKSGIQIKFEIVSKIWCHSWQSTGGDIAEFAEISKKTYAISRFPAKILPVPISPNLPV